MKKIYLLMIAISMGGFLFSQSISRSVIASAGDYFANGSVSVSWTLGDLATETLSSGSLVLTQGFQQPDTIKGTNSVVPDFPSQGFSIKVYPNPATDYLNVVLQGNDDADLQLQFFDAIGRRLQVSTVYAGSNEATLDIAGYRAGIYFLKVSTINGTTIRTFQVAKIK